MGGRISALVAFTGEAFSIKPLVALVDGEVKMFGKAIGAKKVTKFLINKINEYSIDFEKPYALIWSGLDETSVQNFARDSVSLWNGHESELKTYVLGSTIGTHIGPRCGWRRFL